MELLFLFVLIILGFSLYGFFCFCRSIFKSVHSPTKFIKPVSAADDSPSDEINDVRSAERLLEHLYLTYRIDDHQYNRIRDFLEQDYQESLLKPRLRNADVVGFANNPELDTPTDTPASAPTETPSPTESDANGINFSVSHWLSSSLRSSALGLVMSLYFFGRRFLTLGSYRQGRFGRSTNVVNSLPSRAA